MGRITHALLEAKYRAMGEGSPLLSYLIDMALRQCEQEEGASGLTGAVPPLARRKPDDADRRTP